jgi:site-specific DNA recombinase
MRRGRDQGRGDGGDGKPVRVLGYTRVSTLEQSERGTSLDRQREEIERHCRERGYPEPLIYIEAESGAGEKAEARVEQRRLMGDVRKGDLVLVAKQDRWSRDTLHFLSSVDQIVAKGASFFSLAERFDPTSPEGRFAASIMASTAELERRRILDRTIGGRRRLRLQGLWVEGNPPLGYKRNRQTRRLEVDEETAPAIREMFRQCTLGRSAREITEALQAFWPNVKGLDFTAVARRLRDRRYLGHTPAEGHRGPGYHTFGADDEWIENTHPALVDPVTWQRAQDALDARRIGGRPAEDDARNAGFLLRSLARCGHCGHVLRAHAQRTDKTTKRTPGIHAGYYLCTFGAWRRLPDGKKCIGPRARQDELDAEVERQAIERLEQLREQLARPPAPKPTEPVPDFVGERKKLARRRDNLLDAIADGTIAREDASSRLRVIDADLADVNRREGEWLDRQNVPVPAVRRERLRHVEELRRAWGKLTVKERREAIGRLVEVIELHRTPEARAWQRKRTWTLVVRWREPTLPFRRAG